MATLMFLLPALPLAGFFVLALAGRRFGRSLTSWIGVGSVGTSAVLAAILAARLMPSPASVLARGIWTWFKVSGLEVGIDFRLDALSLVFVLVVTWVGFFIHLYSAEYMARDEGYSRFFAYMNLFVSFMLILVLADNLLLLYLGWEGVGLCSYLLIGFWYKEAANGRAARKAFYMTRVGDTALAVGLFLLFKNLGTLAIPEIARRAGQRWAVGSGLAAAASALLLGGAVGKSAQLPLQTWLPDAMAGPTPVSALIHAATMVTAGVYLVCRMHVLFELAPLVQLLVAFIGGATLLISGLAALAQRDIKRVLAYSTISQIGYMFLAMGAGGWSAAVFHFLTHACFKALLFLGAGVVIISLHEEHDIFKMGGLRTRMPFVFWTFLAGAASLSALPLITAGFYSKEMILQAAWSNSRLGPLLWGAGAVGALLTALYTFRMFFIAFLGKAKQEPSYRPGIRLKIPLAVLAVLSIGAGFINLPRTLGRLRLLSDYLRSVFGAPAEARPAAGPEAVLEIVVSVLALFGVWAAYQVFFRGFPSWKRAEHTTLGQAGRKFLFSGLGFDWLYDRLFVRPFAGLAEWNARDFIDWIYKGLAWLSAGLNRLLSLSQSGALGRYARVIVLGAIIILAVAVLL
jgi:NADH-quinone oxidoreductase subunit L